MDCALLSIIASMKTILRYEHVLGRICRNIRSNRRDWILSTSTIGPLNCSRPDTSQVPVRNQLQLTSTRSFHISCASRQHHTDNRHVQISNSDQEGGEYGGGKGSKGNGSKGRLKTSVPGMILFALVSSTLYMSWKLFTGQQDRVVYALKSKKKDDEVKSIKLTSRERRFLRFASVEYDGQLYMTPQDFLESVVEAEPRPRLKRKSLTKQELLGIRESTPPLQKGSPQMFRNLRDKGIISYTEYLFLLSVLTKPQTGFRIAFNMFDTDGNEKVDKTEFLVLLYLIPLHSYKDESVIQNLHLFVRNVITSIESAELTLPTNKLEKIFSVAWRDKRGMLQEDEKEKEGKGDNEEERPNAKIEDILSETLVDDERGLQRRHLVDTTLLTHFFGPKGNREIRYEEFRKFMEDLQTEVQELEFHEFSKGLDCISQVDFAKILLRYTYLESEESQLYLERLVDRIKLEQGITFLEFRAFCQFLNNLDDFNVAMRMYTLADRPISQEEFRRAVRCCTGTDLSPHVIETVFQIFDEDDDGHLSHREFVGVMKDRLHRGFKLSSKSEGWEAFKNCLKQEMRS